MHEYAEHHRKYPGIVTNFLCASKFIHGIWTPLDVPFETCRDWTCRPHILDEYAISLNLCAAGLPYDSILLKEEQWMIYHIQAEDRNVPGKDCYRANLKTARELLESWK
jgi:hypothetical protein